MKSKLIRKCHWIIEFNESSKELAQAFGLGVFVAFLPLIGFQTLIAVSLAALLGQNMRLTLLGCYMMNPFTLSPHFLLAYYVGVLVHPTAPDLNTFEQFIDDPSWRYLARHGEDFLAALITGCVLTGIVFAFASFILSYVFIVWLRLRNSNSQNPSCG